MCQPVRSEIRVGLAGWLSCCAHVHLWFARCVMLLAFGCCDEVGQGEESAKERPIVIHVFRLPGHQPILPSARCLL